MRYDFVDIDFLGNFREGYDAQRERSAKSAAERAFKRGDAMGAATTLALYDTQASNAYRAWADRDATARQQREEAETRSTLAGALLRDDLDTAGGVAQRTGDVQTAAEIAKRRREAALTAENERLLGFRADLEGVSDQVSWDAVIEKYGSQPPPGFTALPTTWNDGVKRGVIGRTRNLMANRGLKWDELEAPKLTEVDLGDRVGLVNPSTGQIVQQYQKGAQPRIFAPSETRTGPTENQIFTRAGALRDDYRSEPTVKNFAEVDGVYRRSKAYMDRLAAGAQQAASVGDIGLVFALAKINDPTSVVRESEFAQVAKAGGYGQRIANLVSEAAGRGFDPATRAALWGEIQSSRGAAEETYRETQRRYATLAQRAGLDVLDVLPDYVERSAAQAGPTARSAPRPAAGGGFKPGDVLDELPDPSSVPVGARFRDPETGIAYITDGQGWIEVRR